MRIINENAEQQFREALPAMAQEEGWTILHAALSRRLSPDDLFSDPSRITEKLSAARRHAAMLCGEIGQSRLPDDTQAYLFLDGDILLRVRMEKAALSRLYDELSAKAKCDVTVRREAEAEQYCRNLAEEHRKGANLLAAYEKMNDTALRESIPSRRTKRPERLALIVEDDHATGAWAAQVLNAECALIHVRSGEEAIISYLENAPDIVFLNIHLPGIDGHCTLRALRRLDPLAYVVMFSKDAARSHVMRSCREGAAGFLKKPAPPERMVRMLRRAPFIHRKPASAQAHV